jgi:hypothetical protein
MTRNTPAGWRHVVVSLGGDGRKPDGLPAHEFWSRRTGLENVFWAVLGVRWGVWVIMTALLVWVGETRRGVLSLRMARRLGKDTSNEGIEMPEEYKKRDSKEFILGCFACTLMIRTRHTPPLPKLVSRLIRNLAAGDFPLFAEQMFMRLGRF